MLKVRNYDLDIIVIYRPPHTNKQLFVKELERVIQRVPISRDIIMFGDYNIDILEDKLDHIACSYLNMLSSRGLQCGIQDITREAVSAKRRTATCIDHVFVRTESASEVQAYLLTSPLADHYLTGLTAVIGKRMPQNENTDDAQNKENTDNTHTSDQCGNPTHTNPEPSLSEPRKKRSKISQLSTIVSSMKDMQYDLSKSETVED
ncbi:unnamed protein product [Parnassius apollo]|uniref:(apollo) hypothetical protein n=1 Tax=Parnassius apollo TaxID=110799 RepID=A0A8S3XQY4_PARAO|nr:unnamed protein product [Parnassius apollo]